MTPTLALEALRDLHEPYLPRLVGVITTDPCDPNYNAGEMHAPTIDEQAAALELWCDACRLPAARCVQYPLILEALSANR